MKLTTTILFVFFSYAIHAQNAFQARTTGSFPYLKYGLGTDRLGGAKMTHLDTNVLVTVIDSVGNDYKVQLSGKHTAYLPKYHARRDDSAKQQNPVLTSSWRVWGDSGYDYVAVGLSERLPYRSLQQINPSRIVVDVFGAASNTNWITQLKTVKEIKHVWYEQAEDDVFRIFIELKHAQHWGHAIFYKNNTLQIRIKQQPSSLKLKGLKIAIDAGHGGSSTGATGLVSGIAEKDYTLKMAKQLEKYLRRKKAKVYMTRTEDLDLSMNERLLALQQEQPDLLISIHLNSSSNKSVKGVSTYYRHIGFRPLTEHILDRMLELDLNNFGNVGSFNFSLSGPTEYPNCLVEVAFLSNAEDEQLILKDSFHRQTAEKIGKGINDWLKSLR